MTPTRFRSNLRFALRKESYDARKDIPLNRVEVVGNALSWVAYEFKDVCIKVFYDPRFITICFTILAMFFSTLLFYPSDTWRIFRSICTWIFEHINWIYVRFCLWVLCETIILGIGMRAFGRFTNQKLLAHYHSQGVLLNE